MNLITRGFGNNSNIVTRGYGPTGWRAEFINLVSTFKKTLNFISKIW